MTRQRFLSLDGLRGACALTVVFFHCDDFFHKGAVLQHGFLAVDVFFLLSGFVIAFAHEERMKAGSGFGWFARVRARRLLPVFWIGAVFNLAIFFWMAASGYYPDYGWTFIWVVVPITTLLMLPAWGAPDGSFSPPMLNVTWSLLVEWVVNLAYAAFLFRLGTRTLAALAGTAWLAMTVAGYFTERGWCVGYQMLSLGLLRGIGAFLAGVVICRLYRRGAFDRWPKIAPELLVVLWLCIASVPTFTATPTFDAYSVIVLCPLLIILLLRADDQSPAWFRTMGDLSYPLYVIHPGLVLLARYTPLFGLDRNPAPLNGLIVVGLSILSAWGVTLLMRVRLPLPFVRKAAA